LATRLQVEQSRQPGTRDSGDAADLPLNGRMALGFLYRNQNRPCGNGSRNIKE